MNRKTIAVIAALAACDLAPAQNGLLITEYFDYGSPPSAVPLAGNNGGTGWAGPWTGNSLYFPANQPHPGGSFYKDWQNQQSAGDATRSGGVRSFAQPLTGTVWFSFLGEVIFTGGGPDVAIQLNGTQSSIGIGSTSTGLYGFAAGTTVGSSATGTPRGSVGPGYLVVAKVEINAVGPNERYTVWFDPMITAPTVAGLGPPDFADWSPGDIGPDWNRIGILTNFNEGLDALRFAYGPLGDDAKVAAVLCGSLYPGTNGDFELRVGVNGALPAAFPDQHDVGPGDSVDLVLISPGGTQNGNLLLLTATVVSGAPPIGPLGIYLGPGTVSLLPYGTFFQFTLAPGGTMLPLSIPTTAPIGLDFILQGLVGSFSPFQLETSNAHELRI